MGTRSGRLAPLRSVAPCLVFALLALSCLAVSLQVRVGAHSEDAAVHLRAPPKRSPQTKPPPAAGNGKAAPKPAGKSGTVSTSRSSSASGKGGLLDNLNGFQALAYVKTVLDQIMPTIKKEGAAFSQGYEPPKKFYPLEGSVADGTAESTDTTVVLMSAVAKFNPKCTEKHSLMVDLANVEATFPPSAVVLISLQSPDGKESVADCDPKGPSPSKPEAGKSKPSPSKSAATAPKGKPTGGPSKKGKLFLELNEQLRLASLSTAPPKAAPKPPAAKPKPGPPAAAGKSRSPSSSSAARSSESGSSNVAKSPHYIQFEGLSIPNLFVLDMKMTLLASGDLSQSFSGGESSQSSSGSKSRAAASASGVKPQAGKPSPRPTAKPTAKPGGKKMF